MTESATPVGHREPSGSAQNHIDVNWTRRSLTAFVFVLYLEKYLFWAGLVSVFYVVAVSQWVAPVLQLDLPIVLSLCLLGIVTKFAAIGLFSAKKASELWKGFEFCRLPMALSWTGDQIELASQERRVVLTSSAFSEIREVALAFVLELASGSFYLIPKRLFSSKQQVDEFRTCAQRSLARNPQS